MANARHASWHLALLSVIAHDLTGPLGGELVSYEGFESYSAGVQLESGATGTNGTGLDDGAVWNSPYNVSNDIKHLVRIENRSSSPVIYSAGDITIDGGIRALRFYDQAIGGYAVRRRLGAVFSAALGESLWFSFLFRTAGGSPLVDQDFFQVGFDDNLNPSGGNPRASIGANTTSSTFPSEFRFFARSTTAISSSAFDESVEIQPATTYLLVGQIQPNAGVYDTVRLYINPTGTDSPGLPSAVIQEASGMATLSHLFIRTVGLDAFDAYVVDEIHVGRDYGTVVQSLTKALRILPAPIEGGNPVIRWPVSISDIVVETSTSLAPGSWEEVTGPFTQNGTDHEFPIPVEPGKERQFFRLRRF